MQGSKNLTIENKAALVDLIEELKPAGNAGWERVYVAYNKKYPDATCKPKTLRKLWDELTAGWPPTGNSPMDALVRCALDTAAAIEVATATKTLDDEEVPPPIDSGNSDEDESGEDELDEEFEYDSDVEEDIPDWALTDLEDPAPAARPSGSSRKEVIFVAGTPSLGEGDLQVKSHPKPRPKPVPAEFAMPATPSSATVPAKPPFALGSSLSTKPKPKVKIELGSSTKGKGKAKGPVFPKPTSNSDFEVLSDDGGPSTSTSAKRKAAPTAVDNVTTCQDASSR
ncbi:hypothetical protein FRC10_003951 [Ceratobasidium sp. 414]|nr:hypothetical protein FRC10_003951 [Ceratobasidium sp. 414]